MVRIPPFRGERTIACDSSLARRRLARDPPLNSSFDDEFSGAERFASSPEVSTHVLCLGKNFCRPYLSRVYDCDCNRTVVRSDAQTIPESSVALGSSAEVV